MSGMNFLIRHSRLLVVFDVLLALMLGGVAACNMITPESSADDPSYTITNLTPAEKSELSRE